MEAVDNRRGNQSLLVYLFVVAHRILKSAGGT